jgi:hypothetical protein
VFVSSCKLAQAELLAIVSDLACTGVVAEARNEGCFPFDSFSWGETGEVATSDLHRAVTVGVRGSAR